MLGASTLGMAKILENMEIGHNVMHGQWDWMNDPVINSRAWDWDTASTAESWRHSHNYIHHTYTNILGKDKDLGYDIMRIDPSQKWNPVYLFQPLYNIAAVIAVRVGSGAARPRPRGDPQGREEHGGAAQGSQGDRRQGPAADPEGLHRLAAAQRPGHDRWSSCGRSRAKQQADERSSAPTAKARRSDAGSAAGARASRGSVSRQLVERKSFREPFRRTLTANIVANLIRNVWSYAIIFCGHFPDQTYTFTQEETENETRGGWYVRQLLGAANIEGGPMFHVISGNLGYQVEHHLFPDMPSTRYGEIAPKVREICERYGLPYNTGPFHQQLGSVQRTILRLAFPGGKPRPKPGPVRRTAGARQGRARRRDQRRARGWARAAPPEPADPCDNPAPMAVQLGAILTAMVTPFDERGARRRGGDGAAHAPSGRPRLRRTGGLRHHRRGGDAR